MRTVMHFLQDRKSYEKNPRALPLKKVNFGPAAANEFIDWFDFKQPKKASAYVFINFYDTRS